MNQNIKNLLSKIAILAFVYAAIPINIAIASDSENKAELASSPVSFPTDVPAAEIPAVQRSSLSPKMLTRRQGILQQLRDIDPMIKQEQVTSPDVVVSRPLTPASPVPAPLSSLPVVPVRALSQESWEKAMEIKDTKARQLKLEKKAEKKAKKDLGTAESLPVPAVPPYKSVLDRLLWAFKQIDLKIDLNIDIDRSLYNLIAEHQQDIADITAYLKYLTAHPTIKTSDDFDNIIKEFDDGLPTLSDTIPLSNESVVKMLIPRIEKLAKNLPPEFKLASSPASLVTPAVSLSSVPSASAPGTAPAAPAAPPSLSSVP